jgi:hypothetical protein
LALHSSGASQGVDLLRSLFACTNANQAATCTCNTRPRISLHHIVNHSSQPGETIHRSSDALVLRKVGGAQGGYIPGMTGSLGAAGPRMCHLSPWTPLITVPEAVVRRLIGSVLPSTRVGRCAGPPPCRVMHMLCSGTPRIASGKRLSRAVEQVT